MATQTDWVGLWFKLLQERGHDTDVIYGYKTADDDWEWQKVSHALYDGAGFWLQHFRGRDLNPKVPVLPAKHNRSWFSRWLGLIPYFRFIPVFSAQWRKTPSENPLIEQKKFVYRVLSKDETKQFIEHCRTEKVSVNSQLLWAIGKTIEKNLIENTGPHYWMVPVNMRGAVRKSPDTSNHASWIWADTLNADSAREVQAQIDRRFAEGFHWGAWIPLNIGKLIRSWGMKKLLQLFENNQERWVGTFSNLGSWNVESATCVTIAPTAATTPLSACCITVNGCMALSLNAESSLGVSADILDKWLGQWIEIATSSKLSLRRDFRKQSQNLEV